MTTYSRPALCWILALLCQSLLADGIRDNDPTKVRPIPRPGIALPDAERKALQTRLVALEAAVEKLAVSKDARVIALLPDVEIFARAVRQALDHDELFSDGDKRAAGELLDAGAARAAALSRGEAPWSTKRGLVVRGYRSRLDDTVQPYGLVIPESYAFSGTDRVRLDIWFHGRGETMGEVGFIDRRRRQVGQYAPADTIVLHPYGRYSNAFKFAGEVDVLEALDDVESRYHIDPDRIAVRGFSMGGAACWQFAVHYADRWFAANPGAGFAETPEFLRFFQKETLDPTWYERKLWHLYDCTDWAGNLAHCPTVAYSGELDIQKQAADMMEKALAAEGIDLVHVIGPGTKHAIHPEAKLEVESRLSSLAERGRERVPRSVRFTTYTLRYDRCHWVTVDALGEHWKRAHVDAEIAADDWVRVRTRNVSGLTLSMPSGWCPLDLTRVPRVDIDGQTITTPRVKSDRSWRCRLHRDDAGRWLLGAQPDVRGGLARKRHGLQGPIDDAFMSRFLIVRPTAKSRHPSIDAWTRSELDRAVREWRRHFRGDARVVDDAQVTDADVAESNLILFGDPASNLVLRTIARRLPVDWDEDAILVGKKRFDAADHALILIAPNPLNPERYVVLNSGFTYREFAYLNNAREVPKLPDWAIVDVRVPADSLWPGKIVAADFFDESWSVKASDAADH